MATRLNPYLHFSGNAREAMEFYRSVLGGELDVMTFGDAGGGGGEYPDDGVMHAFLRTPDGLELMASDGHDPDAAGPDRLSLSVSGDDEATLRRWFEALAEGGQVDVPLAGQVWGDVFGQVTDRFGMRWLVNIGSTPA
ncbi:VOC family protein [Geodermatophilus sp. DSM 45219]|uniref:VOC family protein n=1 Tax=Geodermatophilus sp. DSM 45219 TaxID=1881103 RepID=UPI000884A574|nr:VOC family protein [Geodermatophilus sp. DSM 45219]SDO30129.1 PhnB protein [Geodermatophilus sp. DSM 45219]